MIEVVEADGRHIALFKRGGYLTVRGTGPTRTEALVNLRSEIEAMLIHDERMVSQQVDAVDELDKMLG